MHGTSVASPSVAGIAALIASAAKSRQSLEPTPALIKQCLLETALKKPTASIFEQGAGMVRPVEAAECGATYEPHVSVWPPNLDLAGDPDYFAPLSDQALTPDTMDGLRVGLTVLNGFGASFRLVNATFESSLLTAELRDAGDWLWPYAAEIGLRLRVRPLNAPTVAEGVLTLTVETRVANLTTRTDEVTVRIRLDAAPAKPKSKRLLWDVGHSLAYPPAFAARDSLRQQADLLDWHGDEPWTNFRSTFQKMVEWGYEVDVLDGAFDCVDLDKYGALILADSEDEFSKADARLIHAHVEKKAPNGMGLVVVADWHSPQLMKEAAFFDDNTQVKWTPSVGGANVPSLNRVLAKSGMAFGEDVFEGPLPDAFGPGAVFDSGNALVRLPAGAHVAKGPRLKRRVPNQEVRDAASLRGRAKDRQLLTPEKEPVIAAAVDRVVAFGDSGCLDDARRSGAFCHDFLRAALLLATTGHRNASVFAHAVPTSIQVAPPAQGPVSPYLAKFSARARKGPDAPLEACRSPENDPSSSGPPWRLLLPSSSAV